MNKSRMKYWPQYFAAFTATLSMTIAGCLIGWTSPMLPILKSPDSPLPLSSDDASWMVSLVLLGSIPGNVMAAFIAKRFGRKLCLLFSGVPFTISWILIIVAWKPYVLYIARFCGGIGTGVAYVICPMYIGEIADKEIRGSLGSFIKLMVTVGELYAHAIGPYTTYEGLTYCCAVIPVIFLLTFSFMPESPYYLLMTNREQKAMDSLKRLKKYATQDQLEEDLEQMQKTMVRDLMDKGHFWDLFNTPGNRKAVLISFGLQLVLQFSGLAAVESYTQEILEEADTGLSAATAVIVLSALQLVAGVGASALVDKLGRKPLLLITTLLAGLSLTAAGTFYLLKFKMSMDMTDFGWVLHASVIFYELIMALGLNPLSYMMLGELFPTNVKEVAVSLANLWASLLAFIVAKMYQVISDSFGVYTSFGWFAITCFLGIAFVFFVVPETKGKSLLEIQEKLNCKKKKKDIHGSKHISKENIHISTIA